MLKIRCQKILEAWSRKGTFYLRLCNPAKERKTHSHLFGEIKAFEAKLKFQQRQLR